MRSDHKNTFSIHRILPLAASLLLVLAASAFAQVPPAAIQAAAQNNSVPEASKPVPPPRENEIEMLRSQLAAQQSELTALRKLVEEQGRLIALALRTNTGASNAGKSTAAAVTEAPPANAGVAAGTSPSGTKAIAAQDAPSPLSFKIGSAHITPIGFIDLTAVIRDKSVGSGIGTNYGAIPFANTVNGNLRETRLSAQNSRLGLRVDAMVRNTKILGYLETDFLGFAPGNAAVTSNGDSQRLRLFFVDLRRNKWEFLAGQSWSLLTPNRKGLSPLPGDIFLGQGIDTNYPVGLTWSRDPQFRLVYHATDTITLGWSVEASEQYGGGSGGSGAITLPSGLASSYGSQLNTGISTFNVPNPHQDNIFKIAFDPKAGGRSMHFEVAGLISRFAFYNQTSGQKYGATGGGVSVNGNFEIFKNFRLIANTFYSSGGGRWIFGQGPDLIIRGDGSPSLVRSASTVDGFEYQATPKWLFYGYYGGAYFDKNIAIDPANGAQVGFGYRGSPSNHNRSLQQGTAGMTYTFWKDPNYGALQFMAQYYYMVRHPWSVASGQPRSASNNTVLLNLRYTLPGAPPK